MKIESLMNQIIRFNGDGKLIEFELNKPNEDIYVIGTRELKNNTEEFMHYRFIIDGAEKDFYTFDIYEDTIPVQLAFYAMYQMCYKNIFAFSHHNEGEIVKLFTTDSGKDISIRMEEETEIGAINNKIFIFASPESYETKDIFQLCRDNNIVYYHIEGTDDLIVRENNLCYLSRLNNKEKYTLNWKYNKRIKINYYSINDAVDNIIYTDLSDNNLKHVTYAIGKWGIPERVISSDEQIPFLYRTVRDVKNKDKYGTIDSDIMISFSYMVPMVIDIKDGIILWDPEYNMISKQGYVVHDDNDVVREISYQYLKFSE